jgi:hypothetical protein
MVLKVPLILADLTAALVPVWGQKQQARIIAQAIGGVRANARK